jgi:hypothetical protein
MKEHKLGAQSMNQENAVFTIGQLLMILKKSLVLLVGDPIVNKFRGVNKCFECWSQAL